MRSEVKFISFLGSVSWSNLFFKAHFWLVVLLSLVQTQSMIFPKYNQELLVHTSNQKMSYNSPNITICHNM